MTDCLQYYYENPEDAEKYKINCQGKVFPDLNNVEKFNNKDLLDRDFKYEKVEIDYSYPKYIRENKEKLREFIL